MAHVRLRIAGLSLSPRERRSLPSAVQWGLDWAQRVRDELGPFPGQALLFVPLSEL
jgi:hypothetical protein